MVNVKRQGMSLIEAIVLTAIVGIVGVVLVGGFRRLTSTSDLSDAARAYAQELGMEVRGASCVAMDSDGDGYVSCTVSTAQNGKVEFLPVECAARWTWNTGCRMQKPTAVVRGGK